MSSKFPFNFALMLGIPAIQIGWMSEYGKKLQLLIESNNEVTMRERPIIGEIYSLKGVCVEKEVV